MSPPFDSPPAPADADLLVDREHPAASFTAFYRRHVGQVLGSFARGGLGPHDAADLTAETFAAALLGRYRFSSRGDGDARAWLSAIAAHKLANHQRAWTRERRAQRRLAMDRVSLTDADLDAFVEFADGRSGEVSEALEALPAGHREAVRARVVDGKSYEQIAQEAGTSEAAVRQRTSRGLAALRARLKEHR